MKSLDNYLHGFILSIFRNLCFCVIKNNFTKKTQMTIDIFVQFFLWKKIYFVKVFFQVKLKKLVKKNKKKSKLKLKY